MIATIIAILLALYLHFVAAGSEAQLSLNLIGLVLMAIAAIFLIIPPIVRAMAWGPLQRAEQYSTPHIVELYLKDKRMRSMQLYLLIFPLITFAVAVDLLFFNSININILLPAWIVAFGIALDALQDSLKRAIHFFDPAYVTELLSKAAVKSIQNDEELELCRWIDSLAEVATRAIQRTNTSLCNDVCNEMQRIMKLFLESSKSISHASADQTIPSKGIVDKVSYTLFFMLQRLEVINNKAAEQKLEPVCSNLITVVGKMIISAAKYDVTLAELPMPFLGRFAVTDQHAGLKEVGIKATCTLLEVAKIIITDIDLTYTELKDSFFSMINQLTLIARETFLQDKSTNIKVLTQPFIDLKELFKNEKVALHPDTPAIIQQIDVSLGEFEALDAVLRTMPPMPTIPEDTG